ncbi:MAG: DsbA family protein [Nitrospirales bacterium]|nr:DsbA family protein [Nitrospirales bacterium]
MGKAVDSLVPIDVEDHIAGSDQAQVTVLAYCDFECPYCGRGYPVLKQLQKRLGDRLRVVFRHFPLEDKHPLARQAAEASEAAGAQGQFWSMHHLLFENQAALDEASLKDYAASLGLDMPRFERELRGRLHANRIDRDIASGRRSGVKGTPTFFVNGTLHTDEDTLERLVVRMMEH